MLLCLAILFGMVAVPQVAGAAEPSGQAASFSDGEMSQYESMQTEAEQAGVLDQAGGAASTGTAILAAVGLLVVLGALVAAAAA